MGTSNNMYVSTTGLVLRKVTYSDTSKVLTVLTGSEGKLTVSAHGAHRKKSKLSAATQLLVFSDMSLQQRKDRWTLTEAQCVEQFIGLREDLVLLSLGTYIAELAETVSDEDSLNTALLPLCLNTLYALSEKIRPPDFIKPVFELRLMAVSGFEPILLEKSEKRSASLGEGAIALGAGALNAANYILSCEPKKLFSFTLSDNALAELTTAAEAYLISHLDRKFRTLDYYKSLIYK